MTTLIRIVFIESESEFEYRTDYINDKVESVEAGDLRRIMN